MHVRHHLLENSKKRLEYRELIAYTRSIWGVYTLQNGTTNTWCSTATRRNYDVSPGKLALLRTFRTRSSALKRTYVLQLVFAANVQDSEVLERNRMFPHAWSEMEANEWVALPLMWALHVSAKRTCTHWFTRSLHSICVASTWSFGFANDGSN